MLLLLLLLLLREHQLATDDATPVRVIADVTVIIAAVSDTFITSNLLLLLLFLLPLSLLPTILAESLLLMPKLQMAVAIVWKGKDNS